MTKLKWSLYELALHLELIASGQDICTRFSPKTLDDLDDWESSRERTIQAAQVLKDLAPFQRELRAFLIEQKSKRA